MLADYTTAQEGCSPNQLFAGIDVIKDGRLAASKLGMLGQPDRSLMAVVLKE